MCLHDIYKRTHYVSCKKKGFCEHNKALSEFSIFYISYKGLLVPKHFQTNWLLWSSPGRYPWLSGNWGSARWCGEGRTAWSRNGGVRTIRGLFWHYIPYSFLLQSWLWFWVSLSFPYFLTQFLFWLTIGLCEMGLPKSGVYSLGTEANSATWQVEVRAGLLIDWLMPIGWLIDANEFKEDWRRVIYSNNDCFLLCTECQMFD